MSDAQLFADFLVRFSSAIFSWPVAIILVALWFRQPITKFLNGLRRLTAPGIGLEADILPPQPNQTIADEVVLSGPKTEQGVQAPAFADKSPWHKEVREQLLAAPAFSDKQPAEHRAAVYFNSLVLCFADLLHERSYRTIFASQLSALQLANQPAGLSLEAARQIFDAAPWPEGIEKRIFERWRDWLIRESLVEDRNGTLFSTARGVDFLRYFVEMKLPPKQW